MSNCINCAAPFTGRQKCEYCGTSRKSLAEPKYAKYLDKDPKEVITEIGEFVAHNPDYLFNPMKYVEFTALTNSLHT